MLELKNISLSTPDGKDILRHVDLTVEDNSFVVITGPNGGGKSTMAKVISGVMTPTEGQVLFNGQDITGLSITERAQLGISYAFQQPVRFKGIRVRDLLSLAAGKDLPHYEACAYLGEVGLCANDYVDREVDGSLSGGEIKRIEIALSIARHAPLSVFDEPEAGIDLWSFQNLIKVFRKMREEINGSIVIISHQERILDIADKIVVLSGGVVSAKGRKDEILPSLLSHTEDSYCAFCPEQA